MNQHTPSDRYSTLSIWLHWLMLLLLIAVYACIELRDFFPRGSAPRIALSTWHFMLGISVLFLVVIRLVARHAHPIPPITPAPPRLQMLAANLLHIALYLFMICMPLAGWLMFSAWGKPVPFFGLELPPLISVNRELGASISEVHKTMGNVGYFLIGLHAAAGLYHHYFVRDNVLKRILPWRS
jgi:superoxide oxidase